ncbi:hypothetical protein D3C71_1833530 [compost metagenome]
MLRPAAVGGVGAEPRPAQRDAAADGLARLQLRLRRQVQQRLAAGGDEIEQLAAIQAEHGAEIRVAEGEAGHAGGQFDGTHAGGQQVGMDRVGHDDILAGVVAV